MRSKTLNTTLVGLAIFILCAFTAFKLYRIDAQNKQTRANLPYLDAGEHIEYFDLIGEDLSQVDSSVFNWDRPAMIFITSRPCTPCQKNLLYWQKFKKILGDCIDFYGVIPTDATTAFNFSEKVKLNFKIYVPVDLDKFIRGMRLKSNHAQTILYSQNKVKYVKLGNIDGGEAGHIIDLAKKLINNDEWNKK